MTLPTPSSPFLRTVFAVLMIHASPAFSAADSQAETGPETTEAQALQGLNLDAPGLEGVKAAAQTGSIEAVKEAYLRYRRTACPAKWDIAPSAKPAVAKAQSDPAGDAVCQHILDNSNTKFHIFPHPVDMGKDFNWTHNPRQPTDPAYTLEFTWCEVSRTHFWNKLADAYWKTLDEKYATEWVAQLQDFCRKNARHHKLAPGEPSLWRTLDSSERMYDSWPYAYYHFLESPAFTPEAQWVYLRSVIDHAEHLKEGLKVPGHKGNWAASECFGLLAAGILFPELKAAKGWRDFALNRLVEEAECSVPPDGFEAELTPGYHYFTLSCFTGPLKLAKLNNVPVPEVLRAKILSMYQAPVLVMDQSGSPVPTNDSGTVNVPKYAKEGLDLLGDDPLLLWAATRGEKGTAPATSTMLPNAGFYTMRTGWKPDDLFLFFRAGPPGFAHDHEDMLQVVLRAWNKNLLIEPGGYTYDHSDWRRYAIGTASHNTIIVDGKWQHRGANNPPVPECRNPWQVTGLFDYVSGRYDGGYQKSIYDCTKQYVPQTWEGKPDFSISHTRHVLFLKPWYALVVDTLDGTGTHEYEAHFNIDAPSAALDPATQAITSQNAAGEAQVALFPLNREGLEAEIVQGRKEPLLGWVPGIHRPIPTACYRKKQPAPASFVTFLYPFKDQQPSLKTAALEANDTAMWATTLATPNEESEVIIAKDDQPHAWHAASKLFGAVQARSSGMVIRRFTASGKTVTGSWGADLYNDARWSFKLSRPATLVWSVQGNSLVIQNTDATEPVRLSVTRPFTGEAELKPGEWVAVSKAGANPCASPWDSLGSPR